MSENRRRELLLAITAFALICSVVGYAAGRISLVERTWQKLVHFVVAPDITFPDEHARMLSPQAPPRVETTRLIFDTDIGNDVDDVLALALIHELADRGEVELLAVTISKDNRWCAPHVDLINTFYGRPDVPIGVVRKGVTPDDGNFNAQVVRKQKDGRRSYSHDLVTGEDAPEAVSLLRRVLSEQPDGSVLFVSVGFLTNAARLLDSPADAISPLSGLDLVRRKVRLYVAMFGAFNAEREPEYNALNDAEATRAVLSRWPTPVVVSGFEVGRAIRYPAASIQRDFRYVDEHPIVDAYYAFMKMPYDRPTWDLTAVLYGVRPDHGYFGLSAPGRIELDADDITRFRQDSSGTHRYLVLPPNTELRLSEMFVQLVSSPPGR